MVEYGKIINVVFEETNDEPYEGLILTTESKETISLLISSRQSCCESWGVNLDGNLIQPEDYDNIKETLIGKNVLNVYWAHAREKELVKNSYECGSYACVNILTEQHNYQVDLWCNHNGYYAHTLRVKWKDYQDIQTL